MPKKCLILEWRSFSFQFPLHVYHHLVGMEVNVETSITAMIIPAHVSMDFQEGAVNVSNRYKVSL